MESDTSVPSTPPGEDREIQAMLTRMREWKSRGYDVSRLEQVADKPEELKSIFFDFLSDLHTLESVEEELDSIDAAAYSTHVDVIRSKLNDPDMAEEANYELAELKQRIERDKLDSYVGRSAERVSAAMRKGFDPGHREDVLREELRRIREEEAEKLRREELARIREEEIERIRREERRRLIAQEKEKLRREAREREMFDKTVKKTLRDIKIKGKKYKTCPACGEKIEITTDKRPLKLKCGGCGKEYTLKGDSDSKFRRCKCGNVMGIPSKVRPLKISCKKCGRSYLLKEKSARAGDDDIQMIDVPGRTRTVKRASRVADMEAMKRSQEDVLSRIGNGPETRNGFLEGKNYARPGSPDEPEQGMPPGPGPANGGGGARYCPNCGGPVAENFNVCGHCGYNIKENVPAPVDPDPLRDIPSSVPSAGTGPGEQKPDFPGLEPARVGTRHEMPGSMMGDLRPADGDAVRPAPSFFDPPDTPGPRSSTEERPSMGETGSLPSLIPKFCPKCGNEIPEGGMFCGSCGFKF